MILWVDVETTGLEPAHDELLELALVLTDDDLTVQMQQSWTVFQSNLNIEHWSETVRKMHTESGLVNDIIVNGKRKEAIDTEFARRFLRQAYQVDSILGLKEDQLFPMGGSSVHFDREFLRHHLPSVWSCFSHRNIDVSSIKELVKRWHPDVEPYKKADVHRALPDVLDSINELRYYRRLFFGENRVSHYRLRFEHDSPAIG